jgi:hypothetical protein
VGGASVVKLDFTAATDIECDGGGNLVFTYDSDYLPLGSYTLQTGGDSETIELLAEGSGSGSSSTSTPPPTPTPTPVPSSDVRLIANEIDYVLSADLLAKLKLYNVFVMNSSAPQQCTLILGGPDAMATGDVVKSYLSFGEQDLVRQEGSKEIFKKDSVLIVAGSDRFKTHEAFEDGFMEVVANLISCLGT